MSNLQVERIGSVAVVTIDRPPVNAVDRPTLRALRDTFRSFDDDRDLRAAVLTAAGSKAFCGGADLHEQLAPIDPDATPPTLLLDRGRLAREAMWAITDCAVPVIAAVNGIAVGAGLALAVCCDILLAADHATFGTAEINVGLLGASAHLLELVGRHKAREMFLLGELVPAAELHRLGAVRKLVPLAGLRAEALALAAVLAAKSPIAMRLAKESMNRIEGMPLKDAYRTEQDYTLRLRGFEDATDARAFVEKRPPEYHWR